MEEKAKIELGMSLKTPWGMPSGRSSKSSSTMTRRYMVEKLMRTNYHTWKLRMNHIVEGDEVLGIISGKLKRLAWEPELKEWKSKDLDAQI